MNPSTVFFMSLPYLSRNFAGWLFVTLLTVWLLPSPLVLAQNGTAPSAASQREAEPRTLKLGEPIERELVGGQHLSYQIPFAEGQYLNLVIEQHGIDVEVTLFGPEGKQLLEVDSPNGKNGPEPVRWIAEVTGVYRVEVRSLEKDAAKGRYEAKIVELRVATDKDRDLAGNPQPLELRKPVKREVTGGPAHAYLIALSAGQYVNVGVEQYGIDVKVRLLGPNNKKLCEIDVIPYDVLGLESLKWIAETSGIYRLEVQPFSNTAGHYNAEIVELRTTIDKDRDIIEADNLYSKSLNLFFNNQYDQAIPLVERALALRKQIYGLEHPDTAISLRLRADLYVVRNGDFVQAESFYQLALAIQEKALGPEHPIIVEYLRALAYLYLDFGDLSKPELPNLLQRALAIQEKAFGMEHPIVGKLLNYLANLYLLKGDYAKAETFHQRGLAIQEKALGPEHPDVGTSLNRLANLYLHKGDYAKAEPLYQRALAITEKARGPEDSDTATPLNDLAEYYKTRGDYAKAEPLYQRALTITEKARGSEHALLTLYLNNLGDLYLAKGNHTKAEQFYQRSEAIWAVFAKKTAVPLAHPLMVASLNGLGHLYKARGDYTKAEPFYQRALAINEKAFGLGHPNTSLSLRNLYAKHTKLPGHNYPGCGNG